MDAQDCRAAGSTRAFEGMHCRIEGARYDTVMIDMGLFRRLADYHHILRDLIVCLRVTQG